VCVCLCAVTFLLHGVFISVLDWFVIVVLTWLVKLMPQKCIRLLSTFDFCFADNSC